MTTPEPTPLPTALLYEAVRWNVVGIDEDDIDLDNFPQADQINGTVSFTPIVPSIKYIGTTGDPVAKTILPRRYEYRLTNGVLTDEDGSTDIRLVTCDSPGTSPQGWQYLVEYQLDDGYTFGSFRFSLHYGTPADLTLLVPEEDVDGTIYVTGPQGLKGDPGEGYGGGFVLKDTGSADPLAITIVSDWGIDANGDAYWDPEGALPDEAALLVPDQENGTFTLFKPGTETVTLDSRVADLVNASASATRAAIGGLGTPAATPNTFASRDGLGNTAFNEVIVGENPNSYSATRKDYVDEIVRRPARTFSGAAHTLELADENKLVYTNDAGPTTVTVPLHADVPFPLGAVVEVMATNTATSITPLAGVTIIGPDNSVGAKTIRSTFGVVRLRKYGTDSWMVEGDLNLALGTSSAEGDTVVRRTSAADVDFNHVYLVGQPLIDEHAAPKGYVDALGTPGSVADTIVRRSPGNGFSAGYVKADLPPTDPDDTTRKDYVDAADAALDARLDTAEATLAAATGSNVANTLAKRDSSSNLTANRFFAAGATPTTATELTRKDYVDGKTWPATAISDSTVTGRSVVTAVDAAAARTAIGAGTSSLALGTTSTTAKAGNYAPTAADISDATTVGRNVLKAADAATARTAIGAGTSNLAIGTTSTTAKAGDYQPTAANISDSTAVGRSVLTAASAAAARTATGAGVVDSSDASVLNVVKITQAAYDALGTKVATTLYVIVG